MPKHHLVATPEAAVAAAQEIGYPVVVKPVDSKKGRGITLHVENFYGENSHHIAEGVFKGIPREREKGSTQFKKASKEGSK